MSDIYELTKEQKSALYELKVQASLAAKNLELATVTQNWRQTELHNFILRVMAELQLSPKEWSFDASENQFKKATNAN